jgi:hypothetical protein
MNHRASCTAIPQNANRQFLKFEQGRVRSNHLPKTIGIRVMASPTAFSAHHGVYRPNGLGFRTEFVQKGENSGFMRKRYVETGPSRFR